MSSTLDSDTDTGSLSDADPDFDGAAIPTDAPSRGVRWSSRLEGESRGRHLRFSETPKRSARRDRSSPPEAPPPTECETIARAHTRLQPRAPDDAFAMRTDEGAPVSSQGDEPHLQPTGIVRKKRPRGRPRRETTPTPPSKKRKPYDPHKDLRLGRFFRFRVDASGEPGRDDAAPPRWVHGITSHRINARGEHHGKYWVLRDPERGEYDTHEQGWAATLAQDDDARFPEPLDVARLERDGLLEYVDLHFFPHPTTPDAPLEPKPAPKTNRGDDDGARSDREVGEDDHHHGDQNRPKGVALDAVAGAVAGAVRVGAVDHSEDDNDALEALACAAEAAGASTAPAKRTPQRRSPSVTPTPTRRSPHSSPRTPPGLDADRGENEDFVRRLVSQLVVDESDKERAGVVEERRMSFEPRGRRLTFVSSISDATSDAPEMLSGGTPPIPEASEPLEDVHALEEEKRSYEGGERDARGGATPSPERRPDAPSPEASAPASTARETSTRETSAPASTIPSTAHSPASACDLASTRREILSRIDRAAVRSAAREKKTQDVVLRALRTLEMDRANRRRHTKMILAAVRESRERVEVKIRRLSERFRAVEQSSARTEVRASADVASRGRDGEGNLVGPPRNVDEYRTRGAEVSGAEVRGAEVRGAEVRGAEVRGAEVRGAVVGAETGNGLASDRHPPGRKYTGPSDPRTSRRRPASGVNAGERANGVGYAYASGFDFASASGLPRTPAPWTNTASGR